MKLLLVTLALLGDPAPVQSPLPAAIVQDIAATVQTGSILASQGDCLAVRVYTLSTYTHVATVVMRNGQPFVYDAVPGRGVRCLPLGEYLISQQPTDIQLLHPAKKFDEKQAAALEEYLQKQVGRPYDVKHYATGRRCQGLHCSEYATDALIASHHLACENSARVSPSSLIDGLVTHQIYVQGTTHVLPEPPGPPVTEATTWYGRAWQGTKECTSDCWSQTKRWFCCGSY